MSYLNEPLPAATVGLQNIFAGVENAFGSHDTTISSLGLVNTFLNAIIGLLITVAVIAFLGYLLGWIFSDPGSDFEKQSVRGSMRTFVALFLMVNIWGIIWLIQRVVLLSDITAYAVFFFAFLLLGFWSLFSLGDSLIKLFSHALNTGLDAVVLLLRKRIALARKMSRDSVRFSALSVVVLIFTVFSFSLNTGSSEDSGNGLVQPHATETYTMPVIREPGDATLENNHYVNMRYGIEITYPVGWIVTEETSGASLVSAYNEKYNVYSFLNAGSYPDLTTSSREAYLTALWRVEKNIHSMFASDSEGILSSNTVLIDDISSSTATLLNFTSYWNLAGGSVGPVYDSYVFFGDGPVYFTFQINTSNGDMADYVLNSANNNIARSIRLLRPNDQ